MGGAKIKEGKKVTGGRKWAKTKVFGDKSERDKDEGNECKGEVGGDQSGKEQRDKVGGSLTKFQT